MMVFMFMLIISRFNAKLIGLVKILEIPALSVNIKIEEAEPSGVEVQIRNADGSFTYVAGYFLYQ